MAFIARPSIDNDSMKQSSTSEFTFEGINDFIGKLLSKGIEIDGTVSNITGQTGFVLTFDGDKIRLMQTSDGIYGLSSPSTIALGGIPKGFILTGKTSNEILEQLIAPKINPTFVNPSHTFTITSPATTIFEVGATTNVTFTTTFDKGQILVDEVFQNYRSGNPTTYYYNGPSLVLEAPSTMLIDSRTISNYIVTIGNQQWNSYVGYSVGPQPYDSRGDAYLTPLPAGETSINSTTIEGVYPIYGNINQITVMDKLPLHSMITGNNIEFLLVSEFGGNKQEFDIPNAWTSIRPLVGIMIYNELTSLWEYPGGSAANSLTFWTTSATTHTIQGNTINYTNYLHNYVDRGQVSIRLVF